MTTTKDCVFVSIPYTDTDNPLMAPAILKSIANKAGKSATTIDLNIKFVRYLDTLKSPEKRTKILGFFREEKWHPEILPDIFSILKDMADQIIKYSPKLVGISVFTYNCRCCAKYLSWVLKKIDPTVKIILGGSGILHHCAVFAENLKDGGAIDEFIYGDGERALFEYLQGISKDKISGLSSSQWLSLTNSELESLPYPDYDDYDFSQYSLPLQIPINSSRGCVQKCDFCDVHGHWKKFAYRTADSIFDQMVCMKEKYGITFFHFTDSLINGNLKEYRELMRLIANYNNGKLQDDKLKWMSFFILRSQKLFGDDDWKLTGEGGGVGLAVGIETLSDSVRKKLGKNFTNDDIDYAFRSAQKFGIKFTLLFLTGHVYETDEDHEFELAWWPKQIKYKDVIGSVNTGTPLGILENTPLEKNFRILELVKTGPNPEDWVNPKTNNTPAKRAKWNEEIVNVVRQCGFSINVGHDAHYILERMRHDHLE